MSEAGKFGGDACRSDPEERWRAPNPYRRSKDLLGSKVCEPSKDGMWIRGLMEKTPLSSIVQLLLLHL